MKRYVFDLDNTLIYTDSLNNDSYNFALKCQGLSPINEVKRITRGIVFEKYPNLSKIEMCEIIDLKYEYFINNLNFTEVNEYLIALLKSQEKNNCILWTSAEERRAKAILEYYNMNNLFKHILFSKKIDILNDIEYICKLYTCESNQLLFYDDNLKLVKKLKSLNLNVIFVEYKKFNLKPIV